MWPVFLVPGDSDVILGIFAPSGSRRKAATEELFSPQFPSVTRKRVCGVIGYWVRKVRGTEQLGRR